MKTTLPTPFTLPAEAANDYVPLPFATIPWAVPGEYRLFIRGRLVQDGTNSPQAFVQPVLPPTSQVSLFATLFGGGSYSHEGGSLQTLPIELGTLNVGNTGDEQLFFWAGSITVTTAGYVSVQAAGEETTINECEIELIPA